MCLFFNDTATTEIYTLSLHDALPILAVDDADTTAEDTAKDIDVLANDTDVENDTLSVSDFDASSAQGGTVTQSRSEEHTSELQSRQYLVCRLLLATKNTTQFRIPPTS